MDHHQEGLYAASVHSFAFASPRAMEMLYYTSSLGKFYCSCAYRVDRLNFNSYLLLVMLDGRLHYETSGPQGSVGQGQVLLLDCHKPHVYYAKADCSFVFLHFDGAQSKQLVQALLAQSGPALTPESTAPFIQTIGDLLEGLSQGRRLNEMEVSASLYAMLMRLFTAPMVFGNDSKEQANMESAVEYIMSNLQEDLSVQSLAAYCNYSPSYFSRVFRRATSLSPYQFILHARVDRAKHLLQTTRETVADIAYATGFSGSANFSFAFRRITGTSPSDFRKMQF